MVLLHKIVLAFTKECFLIHPILGHPISDSLGYMNTITKHNGINQESCILLMTLLGEFSRPVGINQDMWPCLEVFFLFTIGVVVLLASSQ